MAFDVDVDGIVHVRATDLLAGTDASARFVSSKQLDLQEIARLVDEADALADHDRDERERIEAGIEAESAIAAGELALDELAGDARSAAARDVDAALWRIRDALAEESVEELRARSAELRRLLAEGALPERPDRPPP